MQVPRSPTCSVAPGTTAGVSAGLLPVPEGVQLLARVLGGRQHVQVALLLTEPAGVLTEGDRGRQPQDEPANRGPRRPAKLIPHFLFTENGRRSCIIHLLLCLSHYCQRAAFKDRRTSDKLRK